MDKLQVALQQYVNREFFYASRGEVRSYWTEPDPTNPADQIIHFLCTKVSSRSSSSAEAWYRVKRSVLQAKGFLK
jgi:hypothetical protein